MPAPDLDILDLEGVAKLFQCSTAHITRLVSRNEFPHPAKIGHLSRWSRSALLAWLAERGGNRPARPELIKATTY